MQRRLPVHPPGGQRPLGGAPHLGVEVGLIPLVERARRARAERDAQDRGEAEHQRRHHRRRQQPAQAGEHHQAHHARLGQREQVAPIGRQRGWLGDLEGRALRRAYKDLAREGKAALVGRSARHGYEAACIIRIAFAAAPCRFAAPASASADGHPRAAPKEDLVRVALDTERRAGSSSRSTARRAPVTTANFLHYVDSRTASTARASIAPCTYGDGRAHPGRRSRSDARKLFPPIAHEPTEQDRPQDMSPGRIAMANRSRPGTARSRLLHPDHRHPAFDARATTSASPPSARSSKAWTW